MGSIMRSLITFRRAILAEGFAAFENRETTKKKSAGNLTEEKNEYNDDVEDRWSRYVAVMLKN